MKQFSAQYIITNTGPPLKRAVVTTEDDGTIIDIEDTEGHLKEKGSVEFYNGIIVPGFVNCHCHIELSHLKGSIMPEGGLPGFIEKVRSKRDITDDETILSAIKSANRELCNEGVVLCADVCNNSFSFGIKRDSRIKYINLLEVFGIDPEKASRRLSEVMNIAELSEQMDLTSYLIPHSAYSMSLTLFRLLRDQSMNNKITSVHFMETAAEKTFLDNHSGPLFTSYQQSGLLPGQPETVKSHADAVLNEITLSGNLILVHNTFTDRKTIKKISERDNLFYCVCPNSNLYIENHLPPLNLLYNEGCRIVIGTDSLASNSRLSILEELKTLQKNFSYLSIEELICWATINGALALCEENQFGTIETGKNPGLLLLEDVDLLNMKLLPESSVSRLI